jgi:murein L,D-transpeptidase YcbB/YkuD
MKLRVWPLSLILTAVFLLTGCKHPMPSAVPALIRSTVETETLPASIRKRSASERSWEELRRFYRHRGYQPAWSEVDGPLPKTEKLLQSMPEIAAAEGLDPQRYQWDHLTTLAREVAEQDSLESPEAQRRLADLDVELTFLYLTLASDMAMGRVQPATVRWHARPHKVELDASLESALQQKDEAAISESLRSLAPPHEEYARLRAALARYRELAKQGRPVAEQIRQIQLNMERWRWLPDSLGDRYILVNVPEFRMELVEGGRKTLDMAVVVGKQQSQTPVFSDRMEYIELNPAWNIPKSIAENEILPKLVSDPGYLASHDMEYVGEGGDVHLRQRPGPDNPLGQIKFMFPNDFDVYLHDTPADHLFSEADRDFSHGCIRLERPVQLAEYLLREDPKWHGASLREAIVAGEQKTIKLPRPLPVHIVYFTAWVERDGRVQFRKDIYGHDTRLENALAQQTAVPLDLPALRGEVRAALR